MHLDNVHILVSDSTAFLCSQSVLVLQLRGLGGGAAATCNWITNAVVSQTFLTLIQHLGGSGTFWLYAVIALAGAIWVYFALPETNGTNQQFSHVILLQRAVLRCRALLCCKNCHQRCGYVYMQSKSTTSVGMEKPVKYAHRILALHVKTLQDYGLCRSAALTVSHSCLAYPQA